MRFNPKRLLPVIGVVMFIAAIWVLKYEVQHFQWEDIRDYLSNIPAYRILAAVGLTGLLYIVLTGYDYMGSRYVGSQIAYRHVALASFLGYAFSHNISPSLVTGASARFRVYSHHGLTLMQVTQIVGYCALSLWVGFLFIGSIIFLFLPLSIPEDLGFPFENLKIVGVIFLAVLIYYFTASLKYRVPFKLWGTEFQLPTVRQILGQMTISSMDWIFSAGILFLLLPSDSGIAFPLFVGIYMLGFMSGLLSQVPGGLGVFETVVLLLLGPYLEADEALSSLLAFRALYFLLPLVIAAITLVIYETNQKKEIKKDEKAGSEDDI
ncbi:MAG: lysylphosphatidylglycerol synthase domain-containing protein [Balneolales bacterium]